MRRAVVAAFDFDGTLTQRDTLVPFLASVAGPLRLGRAVARNAVGLVRAARDRDHRDVVKEHVLASCLAGMPAADVAAAAIRYAATIRLRDDVVVRLRAHQEAGDVIVVVSASPAMIVEPAVRRLDVDVVLATELEIDDDGRLTGRLAGPNCRAEEKVVRFDAWLADRQVTVHAYGNSPDDAALLARADHAVWV